MDSGPFSPVALDNARMYARKFADEFANHLLDYQDFKRVMEQNYTRLLELKGDNEIEQIKTKIFYYFIVQRGRDIYAAKAAN